LVLFQTDEPIPEPVMNYKVQSTKYKVQRPKTKDQKYNDQAES